MKAALIILLLVLAGCTMEENTMVKEGELATVAGGCFWCIEAALEDLEGVAQAVSGYAGGEEVNPTYEDVASGKTGHREAVQLTFDPKVISYEKIIRFFVQQIDPTQEDGQFVDKGFQYTTAIFYHNEEQKATAEKVLAEVGEKFEKPIATKVIPFTTFYEAEDYHQDYAKKKTLQYKFYEQGSGRPQFKEKVWGK